MQKEQLDFVIIGAQKAGTTSLAGYLDASPEIYIPAEKEIPYFLEAQMQRHGWKSYLDTYFRNAAPGRKWGTSTPQYMMHPECFEAIRGAMPKARIIAILRDPVSRLISHFDMATRLGVESRDLNETIDEQLQRAEHYRRTPYPDHTGKYVASGEYGRILAELFRQFDASQVLVLQFDEITKGTQGALDRVSDFLGIQRFVPGNIGKVRMQGGARKLIPLNHDSIIQAMSKVARATGVSGLISQRVKAKIGLAASKLDEWNVDPSSKSHVKDIKPALLAKLREHYRADATLLESLGITPAWTQH